MKASEKKILDVIIVDFIERTSNKALKTVICACCAREVSADETSLHLLGMLLEPAGVDISTKATICNECHDHLKHEKLPALALANNMWIGHVPSELSDLTLAEQLLIF